MNYFSEGKKGQILPKSSQTPCTAEFLPMLLYFQNYPGPCFSAMLSILCLVTLQRSAGISPKDAFHALLVKWGSSFGKQSGRVGHRGTIGPSNLTPRQTTEINEDTGPLNNSHTNIHSSIIYNIQQGKQPKRPTDEQINNVVCPRDGIVYCAEKERSTGTGYDIDEP